MKNNAKSDYTIRNYDKLLRHISKYADLDNPEEVKRFIANKPTSNGHKKNLCLAYNKCCEHYKIEYELPEYKQEPKQIRIPKKEQIESLCSSAGRVMSVKLTPKSRHAHINICGLFTHYAHVPHNADTRTHTRAATIVHQT